METLICATCGQRGATTTHQACSKCGSDPLLHGEYALADVLGSGTHSTTYRATRAADGCVVAVKELLLRRIDGFKAADLFQREADILRQLDHPQLPRFLDAFTEGDGKTLGLYLVREFIDGDSLAAEINQREHSLGESADLCIEVLDILAYLHECRPPVIHRGITPANILRRNSDGRLVLIDFGSVKESCRNPTVGGSTIAGTFGYMAPEQLIGRAAPSADIYSVAAVSVALCAGKAASNLKNSRGQLKVRDHVPTGPFASMLEAMLERDPDRRPGSAARLATDLRSLVSSGQLAGTPTRYRGANHTRWGQRQKVRPWFLGAITATCILAIGVGLVAWGHGPGEENTTSALSVKEGSAEIGSVVEPTREPPPEPRQTQCMLNGDCRSIDESFEHLELPSVCSGLADGLNRREAVELRGKESVALNVAGHEFSCRPQLQNGRFCNLLCTSSHLRADQDFWTGVDALVHYIADRYGQFEMRDDREEGNGEASWTWRNATARRFAPELLVSAKRHGAFTELVLSYRGVVRVATANRQLDSQLPPEGPSASQ